MFTIKMITHGLIEGRAPICFLLERHIVCYESALALLHRCNSLYAAKFAVSKVLAMILRVFQSLDVPKLI